jgi:hypothetical protein
MDRPDLHHLFPLELRYGQSIDAVVLGMGADELHKRYLPAEIESDHHAVVSSRNFEPDALAPSMNSTERLDRLFALISLPVGNSLGNLPKSTLL